MTRNNFYYALTLVDQLFGIEVQEDDFEEIALIAWNQIGNKRSRLYHYTICLDECQKSLELPCNVDTIEAVTTNFEDYQHVTNHNDENYSSAYIENYIEHHKAFRNPLYARGKFVEYERVGDTLYFNQPYDKIHILYKGVVVDENGLPEINDKEALAIATFVAYTIKFKEGLMNNNKNSLELAQMLRQQWLVRCDQARVPEEMSQNDFDTILDIKNSSNRKLFGISFKPVR